MLETLKKVTLSEGDRVDDGSRHGRLRLEWNPGDGSRGSRWTFLLKGIAACSFVLFHYVAVYGKLVFTCVSCVFIIYLNLISLFVEILKV